MVCSHTVTLDVLLHAINIIRVFYIFVLEAKYENIVYCVDIVLLDV